MWASREAGRKNLRNSLTQVDLSSPFARLPYVNRLISTWKLLSFGYFRLRKALWTLRTSTFFHKYEVVYRVIFIFWNGICFFLSVVVKPKKSLLVVRANNQLCAFLRKQLSYSDPRLTTELLHPLHFIEVRYLPYDKQDHSEHYSGLFPLIHICT